MSSADRDRQEHPSCTFQVVPADIFINAPGINDRTPDKISIGRSLTLPLAKLRYGARVKVGARRDAPACYVLVGIIVANKPTARTGNQHQQWPLDSTLHVKI